MSKGDFEQYGIGHISIKCFYVLNLDPLQCPAPKMNCDELNSHIETYFG